MISTRTITKSQQSLEDNEKAVTLFSFLGTRAKSIINITREFLNGSEEAECELLSRLPPSKEDAEMLIPELKTILEEKKSESFSPRKKALQGLVYEFGIGVDIDAEKAHQFYSQAAQSHDLFAESRLGCYFESINNFEKASQLFDAAYKKGAWLAWVNKGLLSGRNSKYEKQAQACLQEATLEGKRGPAQALFKLASFHSKHNPFFKSCMGLAARKGSPSALSEMGSFYAVNRTINNGNGYDYTTAAHFMRIAIENGGDSLKDNLHNLLLCWGENELGIVYHAVQVLDSSCFLSDNPRRILRKFNELTVPQKNDYEMQVCDFQLQGQAAEAFPCTGENVYHFIKDHPHHAVAPYLINKLTAKDLPFFLCDPKSESAPIFTLFKHCEGEVLDALVFKLKDAKLLEEACFKEDLHGNKLFFEMKQLDVVIQLISPIALARLLIETRRDGLTGLEYLAQRDTSILQAILLKTDSRNLNQGISQNCKQFLQLSLQVYRMLTPLLDIDTLNLIILELLKEDDSVKKLRSSIMLNDIFYHLGKSGRLGLIPIKTLISAFNYNNKLVETVFSYSNYQTLNSMVNNISAFVIIQVSDRNYRMLTIGAVLKSALDKNKELTQMQKSEIFDRCSGKVKLFHFQDKLHITKDFTKLNVFSSQPKECKRQPEPVRVWNFKR